MDGALISSLDKDQRRTRAVSAAPDARTKEGIGAFDAVFQHILRPGNVEGFFSGAFVLPGGSADALRNLTAFTTPVVVAAVKSQGAACAQYGRGELRVEQDVTAGSGCFEEISRQVFEDGLTHLVVVSAAAAERFEKHVLRLAGDLYFEAKCAKVRPFAVRHVDATREGSQGEARQVFAIGISWQAGKSKIPMSADDLDPREVAVREVAQRWSAMVQPADEFLLRFGT